MCFSQRRYRGVAELDRSTADANYERRWSVYVHKSNLYFHPSVPLVPPWRVV